MKTIPEIKSIRKQYKETNYSAIYGVYPKRLSRELGISRNKAKELLDAYWKRNWSVKEVVKKLKTKVVNNKTWVQNPVSGFWHELKRTNSAHSISQLVFTCSTVGLLGLESGV
jgi:Leu/Phe-tRNA-protein transferase